MMDFWLFLLQFIGVVILLLVMAPGLLLVSVFLFILDLNGWSWLSYPELEPHLVNPDHTPSEHNPDHAQGPKWTPVMVDRSTHWAPSARVHHYRNTWYLILELTQTRADYCMTHSCNHTTRRPIKIISSLACTLLLVLSLRHRLLPAITARHLVCHSEYGTLSIKIPCYRTYQWPWPHSLYSQVAGTWRSLLWLNMPCVLYCGTLPTALGGTAPSWHWKSLSWYWWHSLG